MYKHGVNICSYKWTTCINISTTRCFKQFSCLSQQDGYKYTDIEVEFVYAQTCWILCCSSPPPFFPPLELTARPVVLWWNITTEVLEDCFVRIHPRFYPWGVNPTHSWTQRQGRKQWMTEGWYSDCLCLQRVTSLHLFTCLLINIPYVLRLATTKDP